MTPGFPGRASGTFQGVNGGGWAHYVGQEKVRPFAGWQRLATAADRVRPSRQMAGTPYWYLHTGQWRYEGYAAITLLAGRQLPTRVGSVDLDTVLLGAWMWATLLVPVLLAAGVWRRLRRRVPLVYAPALWCVVFPTGMYAAAAWLAVSALLVARAERTGSQAARIAAQCWRNWRGERP
ncbi:hypothetical protein [Streptomyces daliensis]|uniref:Uncharacterized protein n=1 Tax=Streptomyces daliensis TaxID=299421 RepID=A0A8T4IPK8_9ACTN|nr:hypothetical protein [Streptomyces daliensis]